jgi:hypothetical protein
VDVCGRSLAGWTPVAATSPVHDPP